MTLDPRAFHDLELCWRESDWASAVDVLRPAVDEYPEVLSTRLFLACAAARAKNSSLALLHYEKLLVLAVGQGQLFHALAAQRGLDSVHSGAHRKRFAALQQWFRTVPPRVVRERRAGVLKQTMLLDLPPADFRRVAESCALELVGPAPFAAEEPDRLLAVLLDGRLRWTFEPAGEAPLPTVEARTGDLLVSPDGSGPADRLALEPEAPTLWLRFTGEGVTVLRERIDQERKHAVAKRGIRSGFQAPAPGPAPVPGQTPGRPVLVPDLEPMVADFPVSRRRREHEIDATFASGEIQLGLAGTAVAAIPGRLVELSPGGLGVAVPRAAVRQSRRELEGAHVVVGVRFPNDEAPLHAIAKVTRLSLDPGGGPSGGPWATLALDFVLLLAHERARLQEALIAAARDGRWPWDEAPEAERQASGA